MNRYFIKENGFIVGAVKGLRNGVNWVERLLILDGLDERFYHWNGFKCSVKLEGFPKRVFTIEKADNL